MRVGVLAADQSPVVQVIIRPLINILVQVAHGVGPCALYRVPHGLHGVDLSRSIPAFAVMVMLESREVAGGILVTSARVLVIVVRGHRVE